MPILVGTALNETKSLNRIHAVDENSTKILSGIKPRWQREVSDKSKWQGGKDSHQTVSLMWCQCRERAQSPQIWQLSRRWRIINCPVSSVLRHLNLVFMWYLPSLPLPSSPIFFFFLQWCHFSEIQCLAGMHRYLTYHPLILVPSFLNFFSLGSFSPLVPPNAF